MRVTCSKRAQPEHARDVDPFLPHVGGADGGIDEHRPQRADEDDEDRRDAAVAERVERERHPGERRDRPQHLNERDSAPGRRRETARARSRAAPRRSAPARSRAARGRATAANARRCRDCWGSSGRTHCAGAPMPRRATAPGVGMAAVCWPAALWPASLAYSGSTAGRVGRAGRGQDSAKPRRTR